jgi:hypothetical protein
MSSPFVESEEEEPSLDSLNRASLHPTVLSQVQAGQERVISYYSKTLNKAESCRLVLKVNGPSGIGRQATSEDTARRLGKCYSEHSELYKVYTL